jgi:hypothetical protein
MARPIKIGLDYFPMETDFFERDDVNLLIAEFGWKGAIVYLGLLTRIYKTNGYYYQWGEDVCLLFCQKMGGQLVPSLVNEIINGCIKRSLFDKGVFDMFNILTSAAIQQTYIEAKQKSNHASIDERICLLETKTEKKTELFPKQSELFPQKPELFPNLVHKEKQSKEKQSKENIANAAAVAFEDFSYSASRPAGGSSETDPKRAKGKKDADADDFQARCEFTLLVDQLKPQKSYNKNAAQSKWCSLPADRRKLLLDYLEYCKACGEKVWTDNPMFYIMYFDEHVNDIKIPYDKFVATFKTTRKEGYCILKEKDENGSIYFAPTSAAKMFGFEIAEEF